MKQEIMIVCDSLGVEHQEFYDAPSFSIPQLFVMGGLGGMIIITVLLIALLLVVSIFWTLLGLINMCDAIQMAGDVAPVILAAGFKVTMIPICYGLIVYFISLVLRVIQKPRI